MGDPLSIAAGVAGLIQLVQSLTPILVRYVDDIRSYPAEFSNLNGEISGLGGVLCRLQPVIEKMEARSTKSEEGPLSVLLSLRQIQDCRATLTDLADLLEKHKPPASGHISKCLKALYWSLKNGKRGDILARLERQKGILQLALWGISMDAGNEETSATREERYAAQQERDAMKNEREEARKERVENRKRFEENRREQELLKRQKILKWLGPASSSSRQETLLAKRVNNTGEWFLQDTRFKQWVSGDASQLLLCPGIAQLGDIPLSVVDLYEQSTSRDRPLDLSDILEQFTLCCRHFDCVYILFDAFDECDDFHQEQIRALIEELLLHPSVRVMLTSRPYLHALKNWSQSALIIPITAQDHDVREFLLSRLHGVHLSQVLKGEIVDIIAQGAGGMFLLAVLQLECVLNEEQPRKLRAMLRAGALPRDVPDAYQGILERISRGRELAYKILSWIFYAQEPLSMTELQEALAVEVDDTDLKKSYFLEPVKIVEVCRSLISHDETSGIVRFTHPTVQDFLEAHMSDVLFARSDLARILLTYISFNAFRKPCADDSELQHRLASYKLSRYAARWWPEYVVGAGECDPVVQHHLFDLFKSPQHVEAVFQLAENHAKITQRVKLLHFAAFHGFISISRILANCQPDHEIARDRELSKVFGTVVDRDGNDDTPLHVAAKRGKRDIVQLLLERNADVNAKSWKGIGLTPLHHAVIEGHSNVVELLIKSNADVNSRGHCLGETPLILAAMFGRIEIMKTLVEAQADISATTDVSRRTALLWGINSPNSIQLVKLLLKAGADVNSRDSEGRSALHYALDLFCLTTCKQLLEVLLEAGADVNIHCTASGNNPLHTAACMDLQTRQFELNLERTKAKFSTPLVNEIYAHRCAIQSTPMPSCEDLEEQNFEIQAEIVKLLLRSNADCTAKNFNGETPLQCAINSRNAIPALLLVKAGKNKSEFTVETVGDLEFLEFIERRANEISLNDLY